MPKSRIILLSIILIFSLFFIKDRVGKINSQIDSFSAEEQRLLAEIENSVGEKMAYDVKLGSLTLGKSTFSQVP